jgi:hypothetical protein
LRTGCSDLFDFPPNFFFSCEPEADAAKLRFNAPIISMTAASQVISGVRGRKESPSMQLSVSQVFT